jgi:DnaJ-class molecular chaperone
MRPDELINNLRKQNYYERLGIQKDTSRKEISKAYNSLILQWHPDKHIDKGKLFVDQCQVIVSLYNEAYTVLSNVGKKSAYDEQLELSTEISGENTHQKVDAKTVFESDNLFRMATQLIERGQFEKAREILEKVIKSNEGNKEAAVLFEYASGMLSLDKKLKVLKHIENILQINGGGVKKDEKLYFVSYLYFSISDYEKAEKICRETLSINPNHRKARSQLNLIQQRKSISSSNILIKIKSLFSGKK